MRNHGPRVEPIRMAPHDHIGWMYSDPAEFVALAESFLAEGASRGDRLMYVAESPDTSTFGEWTAALFPGTLTTASVAEVYGTTGIVNAATQRATFADVLADALAQGYSGIRVAADNTPLVLDQQRLESWVRWETVADHFMSENKVTGLCAFDRTRVDVDTLRNLVALHPVSPEDEPQPLYRLFSSDGVLWLEGNVDSAAVTQATTALHELPPQTDLVVNLTNSRHLADDALSGIRQLGETGVGVTVRGAAQIVRRLAQSIGGEVPTLWFTEA